MFLAKLLVVEVLIHVVDITRKQLGCQHFNSENCFAMKETRERTEQHVHNGLRHSFWP
jgi:hypothetical protein